MTTQKSPTRFNLQPISLACLMLFAFTAATIAAPLSLSQQPPGTGRNEPAPNVILTVDDSGSMDWDAAGCRTANSIYGTWNNAGNCPPFQTNLNPTRMFSLQAALRAQFGDGTANSGKMPDNRIRLAWQAMHNNGNATTAENLIGGNVNSIKPFSGTHRANFNSFVTSLRARLGTPSHQMMAQTYDYMKSPKGINSPWASNPGIADVPYLGCRRSYHIFMTDGAWNSETLPIHNIGNPDGTTIAALPISDSSLNLASTTPTSYTPFTNQTALYSDNWGGVTTPNGPQASTLADFAFRSWAEDLQPDIANQISPVMRQKVNEKLDNTTLQPFWNPKNDPATWQHITQHTIGFGASATSWTGAPTWDTPSSANNGDDNYGGTGQYSDLVNGTATWQDSVVGQRARESELWHMALNGRGKFYPARNQSALTAAFSDILDNILADTSKPLISIAASGTRLKAGMQAYQAGYDGTNWAGRLAAYPINASTGVLSSTASWRAESLLDASGFSVPNRFVASFDGTTGIDWSTYANLPASQQLPLSSNSGMVDLTPTNNIAQLRLNYIRGDRSMEKSQPGGIFRNRDSRLGDIVNSNILHLGAPSANYGDADYTTFKGTTSAGVGSRDHMVYVGANDGMLHGFTAGSGVEKLAYIPQGIAQGNLRNLTDPTYTHRYFVDGTPFTGDAKVTGATGASIWKTVLVSGLGGGGKGYFALDVSKPSNFTTTHVADLVIADTTATADADIGHMYITPTNQIVRLNAPESGTAPNKIKHRWAMVLGNGYNSTHEAPVLVIQYLDGNKETKKISPCINTSTNAFNDACAYKASNGLSTPRLVDLNNDEIYDVAYAGDLNGNVWKFDLSSKDNSDWKTSFKNAPFFKAKPGQSFTTAPLVAQHPKYGQQVQIGSGKNITTMDQLDTSMGTIYSLWDNSSHGNVAVTPASTKFVITDSTPINTTSSVTLPASLVMQTISSNTFADGNTTYYTSTANPVNYEGDNPKRGWYMDWTVAGQRVLHNTLPFDGQKIRITSTVPSSSTTNSNVESCTASATAERSFTWILNMFNGNPSTSPVFDITATTASTHPGTAGMETKPGDSTSFTKEDEFNGDREIILSPCPEGQTCKKNDSLMHGKYTGTRANWREKQ